MYALASSFSWKEKKPFYYFSSECQNTREHQLPEPESRLPPAGLPGGPGIIPTSPAGLPCAWGAALEAMLRNLLFFKVVLPGDKKHSPH